MKIPQQYDEMKIREHYNSLKDSGMDETQIETDMLYDSPFETESVQAFFNDQKKKEDPSLSGGIQLFKNTANQNLSPSSSESLGGTAPSQSVSDSLGSESLEESEITALSPLVTLPSAEVSTLKGEKKYLEWYKQTRRYKRLMKKKYSGPFGANNVEFDTRKVKEWWTATANRAANNTSFSVSGDDELFASLQIDRKEFEETYGLERNQSGGYDIPLDKLQGVTANALVFNAMKEQYPEAAATIDFERRGAAQAFAEGKADEGVERLLDVYQLEMAAVDLFFRDAVSESVRRELNENGWSKGEMEIMEAMIADEPILTEFGNMKLNLTGDAFLGPKYTRFHDIKRAWNLGGLELAKGIMSYIIPDPRVMASQEEAGATYRAGATRMFMSQPEYSLFAKSATDDDHVNLMSISKDEAKRFIKENEKFVRRDDLINMFISSPTTITGMAYSAVAAELVLGTGVITSSAAALERAGLPLWLGKGYTRMATGGIRFGTAYETFYQLSYGSAMAQALTDDRFYNEQGEFDEAMAHGYAHFHGKMEGIGEGAGMVTIGLLSGWARKRFTDPLVHSLLKRHIIGGTIALVGGVPEGALEEYITEVGQWLNDQEPGKVTMEDLADFMVQTYGKYDLEYQERTRTASLTGAIHGGGFSIGTTSYQTQKENSTITKLRNRVAEANQALENAEEGQELEAMVQVAIAEQQYDAFVNELAGRMRKTSTIGPETRKQIRKLTLDLHKAQSEEERIVILGQLHELTMRNKKNLIRINDIFSHAIDTMKEGTFADDVQALLVKLITIQDTLEGLQYLAVYSEDRLTEEGKRGRKLYEEALKEQQQVVDQLESFLDGKPRKHTIITPGQTATDRTEVTIVEEDGTQRQRSVVIEGATNAFTPTEGDSDTVVISRGDGTSISDRLKEAGIEGLSQENVEYLQTLYERFPGDYSIVVHRNSKDIGGGSAKVVVGEDGKVAELHISGDTSIDAIVEEFIHVDLEDQFSKDSGLYERLGEAINKMASKNSTIDRIAREYGIRYADFTDENRLKEIVTNVLTDYALGKFDIPTSQLLASLFGMNANAEFIESLKGAREKIGDVPVQKTEPTQQEKPTQQEDTDAEKTDDLESRRYGFSPEWADGKKVKLTFQGRSYSFTAESYSHLRFMWAKMSGNGRRQFGIQIEDPDNLSGESWEDGGTRWSIMGRMPGHTIDGALSFEPIDYNGKRPFRKRDKQTGEELVMDVPAFTYKERMAPEVEMRNQQQKARVDSNKRRNETLRRAAQDAGYNLKDLVGDAIPVWDLYSDEALEYAEAQLLEREGIMIVPNVGVDATFIPMRAEDPEFAERTGKRGRIFGPSGVSYFSRRGENPLIEAYEAEEGYDPSKGPISIEYNKGHLLDFAAHLEKDGVIIVHPSYSPTSSGRYSMEIILPASGPDGTTFKTTVRMNASTGVGYQDQTAKSGRTVVRDKQRAVVAGHTLEKSSNEIEKAVQWAMNNNALVVVAPRMLGADTSKGDPDVFMYFGNLAKTFAFGVVKKEKGEIVDEKTHEVFGNYPIYTSKGRTTMSELYSDIVDSIFSSTEASEMTVDVVGDKSKIKGEVEKKGKKEDPAVSVSSVETRPHFEKLWMGMGVGNIEDLQDLGFIVTRDENGEHVVTVDREQIGRNGYPLAVVNFLNKIPQMAGPLSFTGRSFVVDRFNAAFKSISAAGGKQRNAFYIFGQSDFSSSLKGVVNMDDALWTEKAASRGYVFDPEVANHMTNINPSAAYSRQSMVDRDKVYVVEFTDRPTIDEMKGKDTKGTRGVKATYVATMGDVRSEDPSTDNVIEQDLQSRRRAGVIEVQGGDHWSPSGRTAWGNFVDFVGIKLQDKYFDIIGLQRDIEAYNNARMNDSQDFNMAIDLMYGKTRNDLEVLEGYLDEMKRLMSLNGINAQDLSDFLYARTAGERNSWIATRRDDLEAGSGMTNGEASDILNNLDSPEMRDLADMVYAIIEDTRQTYVKYGLETRETVDAWRSMFDYYVPLQGLSADEQDSETTSYPTGGAGMAVYGSMSRKAKGRSSKTDVNIIAQVVMQNAMAHTAARKNESLQTFRRMVMANPNPEVYTMFSEANPMMRTDIDGKQRPMSVAEMRSSEHVVPVRVDGKQEFIYFKDKSYARTLNGMTVDQQNIVTKALRVPAQWMRNMFTIYDPNFFVTNFERDIQSAVYNALAEVESANGSVTGMSSTLMTVSILSNSATSLKAMLNEAAFGREMGPEMAAQLELWKSLGGQTGWGYSDSLEDITKALQDATNPESLAKKIFSTPKQFFGFVEGINEAFENSIRFAAFQSALEQGATPERAAQLSKNITVNFNRSGEWGATLNSIYLFFNAAMQGNARLAKSILTGKQVPIIENDQVVGWKTRASTPQKIAAGMTMFSGLITMFNLAASGTDPEDGELWYDKIEAYEKERNIIIMKPGGKGYYKIALPYGYNIFNNFGVAAAETMSGHMEPDEAFWFLANSGVSAFSPISFGQADNAIDYVTKAALPTALKPFAEVGFNETYYGGQVYQEQLPFGPPKPDSEMARYSPEWIQEMFVNINAMTGGSEYKSGKVDINPDPYYHIFQYFLGGAGRFVTQTGELAVNGYRSADAVMEDAMQAEDAGDIYDALTNGQNYMPIELDRAPIVRKMYGEAGKYYDYDLYRERSTIVLQLDKERVMAPMPDGAERYKGISVLGRMYKNQEKKLENIRRQRKAAKEIVDPIERTMELNRLEEIERTIMVQFNKAYEELRGED